MKNYRIHTRLVAALLVVLFVMCAGSSALAASFKARIISDSARVYNIPSTSSRTYADGGKGVVVNVTAYTGNWARINYQGHTGYMQVKYLNMIDRLVGYTAKKTPLYRSDSYSSGSVGTLPIGTAVYVVGMSGGFYRVQNASASITGYIPKGTVTTRAKLMAAYKKYLADKNSSSSSGSSNSSSSSGSSSSAGSGSSSSGSGSSSSSGSTTAPATKIDKIIALAKSYLGVPYSSGNNAPNGFNCSSFVNYCYEKQGYDMQGTAVKQAADGRYAKITGLSNMKAGDILCFDTNDDGVCDHTAIYLGDKKFIEASETAGKVQYNEVDSWYSERLMWARRVS